MSDPRALTATVYVAQSDTGKGDGSSCANAKPYSWFNDRANWGSPGSGSPITPGTIIGLCGKITGDGGKHAVLTVQGSGTPGRPITIYWERDASVQDPACYSAGPNDGPGCFSTNGQSYLTLNGGANGSILSTANGFGEPNGEQVTMGIWAVGSSHLVVENLNISDMWRMKGPVAGVAVARCSDATGEQAGGIQFGYGSDVTIANDTFRWDRTAATWQVGGTDANVAVFGNTMSADGTAMNWVSNSNGGGNIGPVKFYDNKLGDFAPWETGKSACVHDDGIHGWDSVGFRPPHYKGVYIYDNRFSGIGAGYAGDATSYIFLEGGTSNTIFADSSSPVYIFDNVLAGVTANALVTAESGAPHIYNNTFLGTSRASGACIEPYADGTENGAATVENNVLAGCDTLADMYSASGTVNSKPVWDYNVYEDGGGGAWLWGHDYEPFTARGFRTWQSSAEVNGDRHSCATVGVGNGACRDRRTTIPLNPGGSLKVRSPAIAAAKNLTALCAGDLLALCRAINGEGRSTTGPWDAGAY